MLLAQSGKPPVHPPKADFGRAFQDDAATAVHRNAARDGRSRNPPLHAGHTPPLAGRFFAFDEAGASS